MPIPLRTRVTVVFVAGILLVAGVCIESVRSTLAVADNSRWTAHTLEVISNIQAARSHLEEALGDERGYIITGDDSLAAHAVLAIDAMDRRIATVRGLTSDNASQQR